MTLTLRGLLLVVGAAAAVAQHQPVLQLTQLGATLSASQRAQLKAAAVRVIGGGRNRWPSYTHPGQMANYFTPDDGTDHRRHYASQYVRDFTYTFTMAPDVVNGTDIPNILDYLLSAQNPATGEVAEGGMPPHPPQPNCWDNGPFMAKAVASYALLYNDFEYLCGVHQEDNATRVSKLLRGLEFLDVALEGGQPHLVFTPGGHGMYGFTDGEGKAGHVLFDSLLLVEGAQLMADALLAAADKRVSGCEGAKRLEQPFLTLAAAVNDTLSELGGANPLEDSRFGSGLMLATDSVGHNAQPDVWGSGLAVQIGVGTEAQRARMQQALAANASNIFRWGQARHLIWPMCWESAAPYQGFMNQNQCTETGGCAPGSPNCSLLESIAYSWCNGKPCGMYQNGGYWSTPLGWLLPAVARANFTLAASLLQDVLNDSFTHGFNEAVNHDAHYNPAGGCSMGKTGFCCPPNPAAPGSCPNASQTYQGVHGYLASVASVYGAVWSLRRGAAPSPPLPPGGPSPPPPSACVDCQTACPVTSPPRASGGGVGCSNLTGEWVGSWDGYKHKYSVTEAADHTVTFCSDLKRDCWSHATGPRPGGGMALHLTFHRCRPYADVDNASFALVDGCKTLHGQGGSYRRVLNQHE